MPSDTMLVQLERELLVIYSIEGLTEIQQNKVSLTTLGCVSSQLFNKLYKLGLVRPLFPEPMLKVIQDLIAL